VKAPPDEDEQQIFDPYLGLAVAGSWWVLGRWTNRLQSAETESSRSDVLQAWATAVWDDVQDCSPVRKTGAVTPEALDIFAGTVLSLLKDKFEGKPIADAVSRLIRPNHLSVRDDGKFIVIDENVETFWAIEYVSLFGELDREDFEPPGWLNAVGICENDRCKLFFIKQRIDNRFHSDRCRTNSANRGAYKRRGHTRKH
jgi:hypothetical protein